MAKVDWPSAEKRQHIGKRYDRVDGPQKSTGAAKYSFDINRPGMLWAKLVTSPYARATIESVDTSAAAAMPGVKAVWKDEDPATNTEAKFEGYIIAAVAAETEEIAQEAARKVKVQYKRLEHQVVDSDGQLSKDPRPTKREQGNVDDEFAKAD